MNIPFIDLHAQYEKLADSIQQRMQKVLDHGQYVLGPEVAKLEQKLATYISSKHCIANASGTDSLLIALMALTIKPDDEIIVPDFTFASPAEMVALLGAKPIFVDIDPKTYNLDPALIEQAITPKTKAIIAVSLYGQCADFDAINEIAAKHNIPVIEDGAQSFGATYKGKHSCNLTTIGCTSFFPSKPLACYGDGGACFTNNDVLAIRMRQIMNHGQDGRYNHIITGINSRFDTIQAAILLAKLEIFAEEVEKRQQIAQKYNELLQSHVEIPYIEHHNISAYAQYTIAVDDREKLINHMQAKNIPTAVHYQKPLHQQPVFAHLNAPICPHSKRAADRVVSLPFSPYLKEEHLQMVVEEIIKAK